MKRDLAGLGSDFSSARLLFPRQGVRMPPDRAPWTAACLDDDTLAALADGSLDASNRATALAHVAMCARCSALLGSVARAIADPEISREVARLAAPSRRPVYLTVLSIAAAAALVVWVMPRRDAVNDATHRAVPTTPSGIPVPVEPAGTVAQAVSFRWRGVAGTLQYRVILFDQTGDVLFETRTTDTSVALPRATLVIPGRAYLWKVEARIGYDRSVASPLQEFSIAARQPR